MNNLQVSTTSTAITIPSNDSFDYEKKIATLTEQEREKYLALAKNLDITDTNTIQAYGAELSVSVARTSDTYLKSVLSSSNNAVLAHINALAAELTGFESNLNRYNGIHKSALKRFWYSLPGIKKMSQSLQLIKNEYNDVATNVDKIADKIETSKLVVIRDNSTLQQIFESNKHYVNALRDLIIAAKLEDEKISAEIERMWTQGAESIAIQQATNFQGHLRKRIADLQVSAYVFYKSLFEIEVVKEVNNELIEEANNVINHVIPMWKSQLPLSIIIKNQKATQDALNATREVTKKIILQTSSDIEKQAADVLRTSSSGMIDTDTLEQSTHSLINAIANIKSVNDKRGSEQKKFEESIQSMCTQLQNTISGTNDTSYSTSYSSY